MSKRAPPDVDARIVALRKAHRTTPDIAGILCREGHSITPSGVRRVLSRLGLGAPRKNREDKKSVSRVAQSARNEVPLRPAPPVLEDEADEAEPAEGMESRLRRSLASLERAAEQAEADKDVARMVAASRAITGVAALIAKIQPAPVVDVNAQPDMIIAARLAREKMHKLFDRLLEAKS